MRVPVYNFNTFQKKAYSSYTYELWNFLNFLLTGPRKTYQFTPCYYIPADLNDPEQQTSIKVCPFGLCYWVKYSCNISHYQNITWIVYPLRTPVTNHAYYF